MVKFVKSFLSDDSGASAAEYVLILAIVGTGIALAAFQLGGAITGAMDRAEDCINTSGGTTAATCIKGTAD